MTGKGLAAGISGGSCDVIYELVPFYIVVFGRLIGFVYLPWLTIR